MALVPGVAGERRLLKEIATEALRRDRTHEGGKHSLGCGAQAWGQAVLCSGLVPSAGALQEPESSVVPNPTLQYSEDCPSSNGQGEDVST